MKIHEYQPPMPISIKTLILIRNTDDQVLACYKKPDPEKDRHGAGFWLIGPGGGIEEFDKSIEEGASREIKEEIGLDIPASNLAKLAIITFLFPYAENPSRKNQIVHVYEVDYQPDYGSPVESDEIKAEWRRTTDFDFSQMWPDNALWVPKVFAGTHIIATFLLDQDKQVEDYKIEEVEIMDVI